MEHCAKMAKVINENTTLTHAMLLFPSCTP